MTKLRPGKEGEPLPQGALIFRIGKDAHLSQEALEQGRALPGLFELSQADKGSLSKRLSVWLEELTIADQAWDFMGANPKNTVVACLKVEDVRRIIPTPGFAGLDVQWEPATNEDGSPNTRPGAEGHAGISNLHQGGEGKQDKKKRKDLRSKLADLAEISPVPVPHNLPDHQIQEAAFFLYLKDGPIKASPERHWVEAIRQLRRARVQDKS